MTHAFQSAAAASLFSLATAAAVLAQPAQPQQHTPATSPAAAKPSPVPSLLPPKLDLTHPTLFVVGYAHLDTQWRWTYVDTIKSFIPNTLNRNFALFDKYPGYIFNFSGSRRYRMMQEYYPEDYAKLKAAVAAGRWFPCGSSVDENDANVPSAESLVRHVLYGNKFFRREFNVASDEYMLPDCFGFPAALPSVLAHCGIKGFSTQKLTWNAVTPIPFKVGVWEGPDGSSVIAALDPGAYVGDVTENLASSESWGARIKANGDRSGVYTDYHYFGTGDQGGAPKEASVAMVQTSTQTDGPIKVVSSQADWMFKAITPEQRAKLPRYAGELELTEHSAGSISSEAYMKRWNRKNELLADQAERAAVGAWWFGAGAYPAERLENAWYLLLGSQMHDILPGTSVPRAYDLAWNDEVLAGNQFSQVLEDGAAAIISRMNTQRIAGRAGGMPFVVFNPLSVEREDIVEMDLSVPSTLERVLEGVRIIDSTGADVPVQMAESTPRGRRVVFLAKAPPVGFAVYQLQTVLTGQHPPPVANTLQVTEHQLENGAFTVAIDAHGDVSSIVDKASKRELLSAPARLGLHYENPRNWPAWNQDWEDRQRPAKAFAGAEGPVSLRVLERGPARITVEVTRQAEGSTFTQHIRLNAGSAAGAGGRIEFDTDIDWRTRERSLRAAFPLADANPKATYDIQTGAIERGNGHEKQFEYSFHKWFDLTDASGAHGVSVLCDSKYAADKPDDHTVRLTLLHTPGTRGGYPDQGTQDLGRHHVLYALLPHTGDWRHGGPGGTPVQAAAMNQPLIPFVSTAHDGPLGRSFSLMRCSDANVAISAIKKAEDSDEVVIRLRELSGATAKGVHIAMPAPIAAAREIDGQERLLGPATVTGGELVTDVNGYSLRAFALTLGPAPARAAAFESKPVPLPFDTDAISSNANRSDGDLDGKHNTLPAEQLPQTITAYRIPFTLGPTADGQKNALACRGQQIEVPDGFDRVYLLAAADQDVDSSVAISGRFVSWPVQAWTGMIGQWDHRIWSKPGDESLSSDDLAGIEPGYVKKAPVAWYCSHHHTPQGDAVYEYAYLFTYAFDIPSGVKQIRLPNEPRIKVFAATAAKLGEARAGAGTPLFDPLDDHVQDAPIIVPPSAAALADAAEVVIEPGLYWRPESIRYTIDGSSPKAESPAYHGPITLTAPATVKAVVVRSDGRLGPMAAQKIDVQDRTPPSIKGAGAMFRQPTVWVDFSEPLDRSAADAAHFKVDPPIEVKAAQLSPDGRRVTLTLAAPTEPGKTYALVASGIKDTSPAGNTLASATTQIKAAAPVYTLAQLAPEQRGTTVRDVPGLPVKANDPWTLNVFVRTEHRVLDRTIIAGFGRCEQATDGAGRYLSKFSSGIQFWSHNRDVPGHSPLDRDKWQMLTATYDGATLRLYKDAQKIAERTVQLVDDENLVSIAPKDPWDHVRQFDGEIRDLTIWNGALSPEELSALKSASSPQ